MPAHFDCDWDHEQPWHSAWDWAYRFRCPVRHRVWNYDWHLHCSDAMWCHRACLSSRVLIETGDEPDSNGKGTFKVVIDVHHFRGDELQLKVKNSDTLMLEGKQKDDRASKGAFCVTREFSRKYKLPRNYDATQAKATLSTDGVMTIIVPAPPALDDVERLIEIVPTGTYYGSADSKPDDSKAIENGADADSGQNK